MKYYTFKRESNDFKDILSDPAIKKHIKTKISWLDHLMLGLSESASNGILSYLVLKYGDDICNPIQTDYTPTPNIDYTVVKKRLR
jgi:hypothetical protein